MKRAVPIAASALLVLALAGTVDAGNPSRSYQFTACWTGSQVTLEQTWSAINVDEVAFGIGDGSQGLGVQYPIPRSRSGDETVTLSPGDGSNITGGTLFFHGKVAAEDTIAAPAGGWSALPACP
jgi:hypothetical protein